MLPLQHYQFTKSGLPGAAQLPILALKEKALSGLFYPWPGLQQKRLLGSTSAPYATHKVTEEQHSVC